MKRYRANRKYLTLYILVYLSRRPMKMGFGEIFHFPKVERLILIEFVVHIVCFPFRYLVYLVFTFKHSRVKTWFCNFLKNWKSHFIRKSIYSELVKCAKVVPMPIHKKNSYCMHDIRILFHILLLNRFRIGKKIIFVLNLYV